MELYFSSGSVQSRHHVDGDDKLHYGGVSLLFVYRLQHDLSMNIFFDNTQLPVEGRGQDVDSVLDPHHSTQILSPVHESMGQIYAQIQQRGRRRPVLPKGSRQLRHGEEEVFLTLSPFRRTQNVPEAIPDSRGTPPNHNGSFAKATPQIP